MRNYFIFLLFVKLFATIWCQCKFTVEQVVEETRLPAVDRDGYFEILNEDTIQIGTTLHFICTDTDVVKVTCQQNNAFSQTLPIQKCPSPLKTVVEEIPSTTCQAQTYRVGYKVGKGFIELYRSCFNKNQLSSVLVSYLAYPHSLVTSRPEVKFTTDGVMTVKDAETYKAENIFARFEAILGANQPYVRSKTNVIIDRGHLAPSADYLFPVNMRATFKYINAIPQFSTINKGNWKTIEEYVRNSIKSTGKTRVLTGAFNVLSLADTNGNQVKIFLEDGNRNPIPEWIYKIVYSNTGTIVFLTYNNIFNANPPDAICKTVNCPIQLVNTAKSGFTYCCDSNDFAAKILPKVQ